MYLACFGQIETHCKQEMHLFLSTLCILDADIAFTGHLFEHKPHSLHSLFTLGLIGIERYLRYGIFPGTLTGVLAYNNECLHF